MILYKKEPFPLQMRNIMLLDDIASGGVVYVGKNTYDQALLLFGRMDGDPKRVLSLLTTPKTEAYRATPGLKNIVEDMMNTMPKPLNMIAPFLIYCVQNQGIDWSDVDRVFAYGILHQYSQLVDLNGVTLIPAEVRNNIVFPTALLKSYEDSWNDICHSLKDLVTLSPTMSVIKEHVVAPVDKTPVSQPASVATQNGVIAGQPAVTTPAPAATPTQSTGAPKEETMEEKIARITAENRARTEAARKAAEEAKKKQAAISGGVSTVSPQAQKKTEEATAASDVLAEFDI